MGLRVVIPVAGVGTRLRPHTHTRPKVLIHVAGKPMLGHILDELGNYDLEEVALVLGHLGEDIRDYVTGAYPYKFRFVRQEEMKGLGHAIWLTAAGARRASGPLLIVLGDTLFDADFASILKSKENWIGVKPVEDPRRFGVVVLEGDRIGAIVEKPAEPPSNLAVVGIYLIQEPDLLFECLEEIVKGDVRSAGEIQLTDALQGMIDRGAVMKPFEIREWYDCGKPETLLDTNRRLLARLHERDGSPPPERFPGCIIRPPVAIEEGAKIENSIIGPSVTIAEGAVVCDSLVEDSIISKDAEVSCALLRGSLIADNAKVTGRAYRLNVGDSSEMEIG